MSSASVSFTGASTHRIPLGDLIRHHAHIDPLAPAITFEDRVIDRAEFESRCNRRARFLAIHGVQPGDLVTFALPKGVEFYETVFAVWKLGATPNPISPSLSAAELEGILAVAQPRLVIGIDPARTQGFATLPSCPELPADWSDEYKPSAVPRFWKAMTSGGSTGRPKVIVDHMEGTWDPAEGGIAQRPGETILNPGPAYHNGPFLGTMLGLFSGGHVVEMARFDALRTLELIERHGVSWAFLVPTMMHRIARLSAADRGKHDLASLHTVLHSAAPCPIWLKRFWIEWLGPRRIIEVYTGTERQALVTLSGDEWLAHPGSVGRVQPGAAIRIVKENGDDAAQGEVGEIFLRPDGGQNSTYHYLGAQARARGEWESLGDLGYLDPGGYLYLSDRRIDLIIRGGINIYPAEVEGALEAHPAVASSIVVGLPDDELGETVHAIVQVVPGATLTNDDLRDFVAGHLSRYKIPKTFEFVETPLRDDAGKARRSGHRARAAGSERVPSKKDGAAP